MKILLLEDDLEKARRILDVLKSTGIHDQNVSCKTNVADARKALDEEQFDLLILDIRVPFREGELADDQGGIHLLKEILEDAHHNRPRYVVGISGAEDLYDASNIIFHTHGWALLKYSPVLPEWADSLRYFVEHILQVGDQGVIASTVQSADVVILTALDTPEFSGVKTIFPELKGPRPFDSKTLVWEGDVEVDGKSIRVVAARCWQMGLTASSILIERLLSKFQPKMISMTGICAGYSDVVALGDVVIATQSWEWQGGKIIDEGDVNRKFLVAPEPCRASQEVITALSVFKTDNRAIANIMHKYAPSEAGKSWELHLGPIVSGLSVIASEAKMEEIRQQHRKLLGLEMEAYAIYAASYFHPINPKCIVIKGVCDFGDSVKGDDYQLAGSVRSAAVLRALLETSASALC